MPNHFTLTFFFCCGRRDVSCSHSNRDLFTCEDNMLFSHVKISCFRTKAHLVFHWYLYNKVCMYVLRPSKYNTVRDDLTCENKYKKKKNYQSNARMLSSKGLKSCSVSDCLMAHIIYHVILPLES